MQYDFRNVEESMLKLWKDNSICEKARKKNAGRQKFYFLDGPPYTSGKVHIGTAWNKSLKDAVLRYKRMKGFDVWDRAGYDMHGLPIEHQVMKKFSLETKQDILRFGIENFVNECSEFANESMKLMNADFTRLGTWLDYENAYKPVTDESIEAIWWLIKKANEQGRLYEGLRTMTWCASCETALAKHELEYKEVKDKSVFLKFKIKGRENEFLIIWTTTPWTIPMNLGVMANPELEYVKAKVDSEYWIVAKPLYNVFISGIADRKCSVVDEFFGSRLEGVEYIHPLYDELSGIYDNIKGISKKAHMVVMSSEYVDASAGTGLVHMAPGCGPEDYEVGHRNGIPPFNNLSEKGEFPREMGTFAGYVAKKDDSKFIDYFRNKGILVAETEVEHDYAHCWRCHNPVIYRATKQWFFKVEDLKEEMLMENKKIKWVPESGFNAFESWLSNLRDNSITKQRFWGTPLPVWRCSSCNDYDVLASSDEIMEVSGKLPKGLHKPWIDEIKYKCKCGGTKERIPDVMDVWIDPGCASWICLNYPQEKGLFANLYPADFILEGKDQFRGWFNVLMVCSMLAFRNSSFKACYVHGFVQDAEGRKMSKSLGNYILPQEVIDKYGADTFRYYTIGGTNAGIDLNYNFDDMKVKHKNLTVLWNIHNYLLDMCRSYNVMPERIGMSNALPKEERYILSKLNSAIKVATALYDNYNIEKVPKVLEELYLELSRTYIQSVREKASTGSRQDRAIIVSTIYTVILECLKMLATIAPFISEQIYQNLKEAMQLEEESIHHFAWPQLSESMIDTELEEEIFVTQNVIQGILAGREKMQRGVRWPIKEAIIVIQDKAAENYARKAESIIKLQGNIKNISVRDKLEGIRFRVRSDFKTLGPDFGEHTAKIIAKISQESAESIIRNLERDEMHKVNIGDRVVELKKHHLIIERIVPDNLQESEFDGGFVYLNKNTDEELEAEGYARELARRIQALRKKAGMEKKDTIKLEVSAEKELASMFRKWEKYLMEKVGAASIYISENELQSKQGHYAKDSIKGKNIEIAIERLN